MTVNRYDAHGFETYRRDSRGFLRIPAAPTRAGIFVYRRADGAEIRELRPEAEVFHADSLETLELAPVTVRHPDAPVTPENVRELGIGRVIGTPRRDGLFAATTVAVEDAGAIARVESGEDRELSCGYTCDIDPTPGVWQGQRYDAVQRKIRYNHVGLGPRGWGRGGADVALRMDSADAVLISEIKEGKNMASIRLDGVDFEAPDQTVAAFKHALERKDADIVAATERADKSDAAKDLALAELEKAKDPTARQDAVKARVALERSAAKVLGDEKLDGLSDHEIRTKVVAKAEPKIVLDGKTEVYVEALFDAAITRAEDRNDGLEATRKVVDPVVRDDAADPDPYDAKRNAYANYRQKRSN